MTTAEDTTDLTGRVALVTGAGRGLGRSHALALAAQGATVLVNDPGGEVDGTGAGQRTADAVVEEIRDAGGRAEANHAGVDTWEGGGAIVADAVDRFGRLDVVVNNAGILRDKSFGKLTPELVDDVLSVHLRGAFHVTRAAWPHLSASGHGRVVMTSSGSGLYGNFGQAAYGAAKMGLVGLTRTLAIEGAAAGVRVNAIAPLARSRMTEGILPEEVLARLEPEWVSPLVCLLASDACVDSGHVYSVAGGYYARVAVVEGPGVRFDRLPTPAELAAQQERLVATDPYTVPASLADQVARVADRAVS